MLWPTSAGGTPERSSACFEATAPSSIAETSFSVPPKVPKPLRTPERNTTSVFEPWVFIGGKLHVRRGEYRRDCGGAVGRRGSDAIEMDVVPVEDSRLKPRLGTCRSSGHVRPVYGQMPTRPKGLPAVASSLVHSTADPHPSEVRRNA